MVELRCGKCLEDKPVEAFAVARHIKRGYQAYCRPCQADYAKNHRDKAKHKAGYQAWYAKNKDREFYKDQLRKYGLTREQHENLVIAQAGACAICCELFTERPRTDHCHHTEKVRGLLCRHCNTGIGHLRDDPMRVSAALVYLQTA